MAPKKSSKAAKLKNPNASLKAECLRDPKDSCSMNSVHLLKQCKSDSTSNLWPDFKDDPSNAGIDSLGDANTCDQLLLQVYQTNQKTCDITATVDMETAHRAMAGAKAKATFKSVPITKQVLEHAFQAVRNTSGKATKQLHASTNAGFSEVASSSTPAASSDSTGNITQTTSALSALQISGPAPVAVTQAISTTGNIPANGNMATIPTLAPAVLIAGMVQNGPPTINPPNPHNETLQAIPEVGVRRPARVVPHPKGYVQANYFKVTLGRIKTSEAHILHEYQITGLLVDSPNDLSRSKKKVIIKRFTQQSNFLNANNAPFVSNGEGRIIAWRNLDPTAPINGVVDHQNVPDFDRNQHGVVSQNLGMSLIYVRAIDLNDLVRYSQGSQMMYQASIAEEALNILVGQAVSDSNPGVIQIGDNHFFTPLPAEPLRSAVHQSDWGMDALRGYTSHAKAREGGLFLNVNTGLSAFYRRGTVNQHIEALIPRDMFYPQGFLDNPQAKQHLVGVRVRIMYKRDKPGEPASRKDTPEGRLKTITGFSDKPANQIFFIDRSGVRVSVWQHFEADHPLEAARSVRKGKQVCVNTSSTQAGRECWFLPDQLDVVQGQIYRKTLDRLSPTMTATMINLASQRPDFNRNLIERSGLPALGFQPNRPDPVRLADAGIQVNRRMIEVPFRYIPSPMVRYGAGKTIQLSEPGQWRTQGMKFLTQDRRQVRGMGGFAFFCPNTGLNRPQYGAA